MLTVDHYEVEFVQRGREVVRRESHSVKEVVDRIVVRCEDEQLGDFLVAANLRCQNSPDEFQSITGNQWLHTCIQGQRSARAGR